MDEAIERIHAAFAANPRPPDKALLHPDCRDDMDLQRLQEFGHWSEVPDEVLVSEYAALAFLSAEGFCHFIPAYMIWVLRHPDVGEAVVDATIWAFFPELHGDAHAPFVRSKWEALDGPQRAAVTVFLQAMLGHHSDAAAALSAWLDARPEADAPTR